MNKPLDPNDKPSLWINIACFCVPLISLFFGLDGLFILAGSILPAVALLVYLLVTRKRRTRRTHQAAMLFAGGFIFWGVLAFYLLATMPVWP